ncbi:MAG: hypothetical protein Ct9H300mP16_18160 [Pseudomonadota bacterium]|nr:MAG: hypothetical protein Ct9H300mP16_18160 [Pseudomonadota bacterium]
MRYTSRRRHIVWRDDPLTREAVTALGEILDRALIWYSAAA